MPEANETLTEEAGSTSPPAQPGELKQEGDLVSTMEFVPSSTSPAEAEKTEEEAKEDEKGTPAKEAKGAEEETPKGEPKEEPKAEEEHPGFQKRISELVTRAKTAEDRVSALEGTLEELKAERAKEDSRPTYTDISDMEDEKLVEWREEKPRDFYGNLARQIASEVLEIVQEDVVGGIESRRGEEARGRTFDAFIDAHPDFQELWDSGQVETFLDRNPGHNIYSAYYELRPQPSETKTELSPENLEKKLEAARQEGLEQGRKERAATEKAKRENEVLGSGPSSTARVHDVAPELKDTKSGGGLSRVLAGLSLKRIPEG